MYSKLYRLYSMLDRKHGILRSSHILIDGNWDFGLGDRKKGFRSEGLKDG